MGLIHTRGSAQALSHVIKDSCDDVNETDESLSFNYPLLNRVYDPVSLPPFRMFVYVR